MVEFKNFNTVWIEAFQLWKVLYFSNHSSYRALLPRSTEYDFMGLVAQTKLFFLIFILLKQTSSAASYSKFVSREMSKAEALLKVCNELYDGFYFTAHLQFFFSNTK